MTCDTSSEVSSRVLVSVSILTSELDRIQASVVSVSVRVRACCSDESGQRHTTHRAMCLFDLTETRVHVYVSELVCVCPCSHLLLHQIEVASVDRALLAEQPEAARRALHLNGSRELLLLEPIATTTVGRVHLPDHVDDLLH